MFQHYEGTRARDGVFDGVADEGSPVERIKTAISAQIQPRLPPFQRSNIITTANTGKKNLLPLANGINTSKKEFFNVPLMKRNTLTSSV